MDKRVIEYIEKCPDEDKKQELLDKYKEHNIDVNFANQIHYFKTTVFGKTKKMARFKDKFSYEFILVKELNYILKDLLKPNIKTTNELGYELVSSLEKINDEKFTIIQLDFKKYFPSLSSEYLYEFFLKDKLQEEDKPLFENYVNQVHYCNPGLLPSNLMAELASNEFKIELLKHFKNQKIITSLSYVDDFLIIFNDILDKNFIVNEVLKCIKNVFYKDNNIKYKNKTKIHLSGDKFRIFTSKDTPADFNYLGCTYNLDIKDNKLDFSFGFYSKKLDFYKMKIFEMVKNNYNNPKLLKQMLFTNTKRVIIKVPTSRRKYVDFSPYQFYKNMKEYSKYLNDETLYFFKNVITDAFVCQGLELPYYLKDKNINSGYNLYHNFTNNRCVTLSKKFGYPREKLIKILSGFTNENLNIYSYDKLCELHIKLFYLKVK